MRIHDVNTVSGLLLPGLDGSNPLGFLAALGLLHILETQSAFRLLRMSWIPSGGTWVPRLFPSSDSSLNNDHVLDALDACLVQSIENHPARLLRELETVAEDENARRRLFIEISGSGDRQRIEWLTAFASDFAPSAAINQLQTTRRDYFYGNLTSVIARTHREHLRRAIFHPWDYADALDNQSLHLDPSEDRRHALQWNKPAGDPDRKTRGGMLGANRLALEAIPLFPSFPVAQTLRTVGFSGTRSTNTRWTWPIWEPPIPLSVVRPLLALTLLQKEEFDASDRQAMVEYGLTALYRTRRILVGKTPNFTPAVCLT